MISGRVSTHFTWQEFACNDGTPYPAEWRDTRGFELAGVLEGLREDLGGGPLIIGSVYRTYTWNRLKGGKPGSRHPLGQAADCYPPRTPGKRKRMVLSTFHQRVHAFAENRPQGRCDRLLPMGRASRHAHPSERPPGRLEQGQRRDQDARRAIIRPVFLAHLSPLSV